MKTLIIYESKHGTTEMFANRLAEAFGDNSRAAHIKKAKKISLDEWDSVVLGAGIYIGKVKRSIKGYAKRNKDELEKKNLGIFLCCSWGSEENVYREYFEKNFPPTLLEKAKVKQIFPGGQYLSENAGMIYKKVFDEMEKLPEEEIHKMIDSFVREMVLSSA